jgi:hypothetical protein
LQRQAVRTYIPPYYRICTYRLPLQILNAVLHLSSNFRFPLDNCVTPRHQHFTYLHFTFYLSLQCTLEKSQTAVYKSAYLKTHTGEKQLCTSRQSGVYYRLQATPASVHRYYFHRSFFYFSMSLFGQSPIGLSVKNVANFPTNGCFLRF